MDIRRKLSMKTKANQDTEEKPRWIGKKFIKLHRKRSALQDKSDETIQTSHKAAFNFMERSPRFRDEAVEVFLHELMPTTSPSMVLNCMLVCKQWSRIGKGVLQQANHFSRLPEEILLDIFERIKFNSSGTQESITADIASCARTCQQWRRIASPLLYQHFVLNVNYDTTNDTKEYKFHPPYKLWWWQPFQIPTVATWMQTLTIELHFNETGPEDRRITLIGFITSLPSLTTLSIRAAPLQQQHYISRSQLALIVDAIPPTVTAFELDTKGRDASSNLVRQDYHLCASLHKLLPQLHHLRLRMGVMCPLFVTSPSSSPLCPNLETLTIFLLTRDMYRPAACCRPHQWSLENRPDDKLLSRLSSQIDTGSFSNLRHVVFARQDRGTVISPNFAPLEVRRWRDDGRAQDGGIPQDRIANNGKGVWDVQMLNIISTTSAEGGFLFSVLPNGFRPVGLETVGVNGLEAEEWVEGVAAWVSDNNGARRPKS